MAKCRNHLPISDSQWVSPVHVVPKKAGVTVMTNEKGEEIQKCLPTKWMVCIDYRKLNSVTKKDHFPLPFIDQILDRLEGSNYFCFLDRYSGYNQIAIHPDDQKKTTFTCPFGTFAFRRKLISVKTRSLNARFYLSNKIYTQLFKIDF